MLYLITYDKFLCQFQCYRRKVKNIAIILKYLSFYLGIFLSIKFEIVLMFLKFSIINSSEWIII